MWRARQGLERAEGHGGRGEGPAVLPDGHGRARPGCRRTDGHHQVKGGMVWLWLGVGGGGCIHFMHGRCRINVNLRSHRYGEHRAFIDHTDFTWGGGWGGYAVVVGEW